MSGIFMQTLSIAFCVLQVINVSSLLGAQEPAREGSQERVVREFTSIDPETHLTKIFNQIYPNGIMREPEQGHSVREFIGGLVSNAREHGNDGVIDFLKKAEKWGFAVESAFYSESPATGAANLILRYLIALNYTVMRLEDGLNMHNIVGNHDVVVTNYACCDGQYKAQSFSFTYYYTMILDIPSALGKYAYVDVSRMHY